MEIVKLSPMSVPSRGKYGIDKLGKGEAAIFGDEEVSAVNLRSAAAHEKKRQPGKKFSVQIDKVNRKIIVYRIA